MSKQTAVRLPDEVFDRLQVLAQRTGRTATYYIREAIQEHLEDLEDIYFSEMAIKKLKKGKDDLLESEEFWLGLED
jgi:RHH-type rel operon transcriptional repressor/antitoxin RelB